MSEHVHGAVRAPLLDGQRGLVPEARALSHYSGDTFLEKVDYSNLNCRRDRMSIYGPELRKKPRASLWSLRVIAPGNSHCTPTAETNFVDVIPQAKRLILSVNIEFQDIEDPRGLARDVTGLGRWGNGPTEIGLSSSEDVPYAMGIVRQAFDLQMGAQ